MRRRHVRHGGRGPSDGARHRSARAALRVVVTGHVHGESPSCAESLETSPDTGIGVVARVADRNSGGLVAVSPDAWSLHCRLEAGEDAVKAAASLADDVAAIRRQQRRPVILLVAGGEPGARRTRHSLQVSTTSDPAANGGDDRVRGREGRAVRRRAATAGARGRVRAERSSRSSRPRAARARPCSPRISRAYLASSRASACCSIDLDLQFGDAAIMLGLEPERTMSELVSAPGDLDRGQARRATRHVTRRGSTCSWRRCARGSRARDRGEGAASSLEVAREAYDVVVVDTSPFFYGPMLATLEPTDHLLVVCGLDVPTLKNVRLSLRTLELLGFPAARTRPRAQSCQPQAGCDDARRGDGARDAGRVRDPERPGRRTPPSTVAACRVATRPSSRCTGRRARSPQRSCRDRGCAEHRAAGRVGTTRLRRVRRGGSACWKGEHDGSRGSAARRRRRARAALA